MKLDEKFEDYVWTETGVSTPSRPSWMVTTKLGTIHMTWSQKGGRWLYQAFGRDVVSRSDQSYARNEVVESQHRAVTLARAFVENLLNEIEKVEAAADGG